MFKLLNFMIFIFCIICNVYAIDLEYVKARMDKTQDIQFIGNVPLLTHKETQDNSKSLYSDDEQFYYIKFELKDNYKKEDIKHILINYNPRLFNSINLIKVNATKNELSKIVDSVKDFADIEYLQSNFAKRRPNDFITKVVEDVGKVQLDEPLFVENKKDINKSIDQITPPALPPLPGSSGGIGNSSTTDNDILAWTPNDPDFNNQWYLYNTDNSYDLKYLEFKNYLDQKGIKRNFNKNNPVIALVDMGFYLDTAELKDRVWVNNKEIPNNGKDDDGNGYVDDYMGVDVNPNHQSCSKNLSNCVNNFLQVKTFLHGFAMSSIIAAVTNNNAYMTGIVESDVKILPISAENNNFNTIMYYNQAYDYILSLRKRGVNIIAVNLSIGGKYDATEEKMLSEMNKYGILVLASAGNDNRNIDITTEYDYPALLTAKLPNIISVGAVDKKGLVTKFSNYGVKNVNIYMPGDHISVLNIDSSSGNIRVVYSAGTSQAAAVMSGYIGMMYYLYPNMSLLDLKNIILKNSYTISSFTISGSTTKYIANTLDLMLLTNLKM